MSKLTINQFAYQLGNATRKTRDASTPFHTAYLEATPEQRADLRQRWMLGHIEGAMLVEASEAERILSTPRTTRTSDEQKAYLKANSDFSYHVIRPELDEDKPTPKTNARISKPLRDAATNFLAEFEGETLQAQINAAIAVLRAMSK
jgi:hypothetical protein